MPAMSVPATLSPDAGLTRYMAEIRKFPLLKQKEEVMLAERWRLHGDVEAAGRLVTSHLRLVAKIAMGYRGYGLPVAEVISEGNVGLMQAVRKFDPGKGFRLATYAVWWIKASIQEYVLRSWSLVKLGTTTAQKKLFFNLRRIKGELQAFEDGELTPENAAEIARRLDVSSEEVQRMNARLSVSDSSLNTPTGDQRGDGEWQDWLVDDTATGQEEDLVGRDQFTARMKLLRAAMRDLTPRERHIVTERRLREQPVTLEKLSASHNVSRERIRQIEVKAFEKLQQAMRRMAEERGIV